MSFKLEVFGDYALFTRPEMKAERVSYDVMTPIAARGILEVIFWHPGMRWKVDRSAFPTSGATRCPTRSAGGWQNPQCTTAQAGCTFAQKTALPNGLRWCCAMCIM